MIRTPYQFKALQQQLQAAKGKVLPGHMGPMDNSEQVPTSPNQIQPAQQVQPDLQQMAQKQALMNIMRSPKPMPIAMSITPEESPAVDQNSNVSEIVPKSEQEAVAVVQGQDSRDNLKRNPNEEED